MYKKYLTSSLVLIYSVVIVLTSLVAVPQLVAAQSSTGSSQCGEFTESGPLCLPNNPFNNASKNSLVNTTTATGLLATVIKWLLYFGGMIAVLMVIIGGYYYLTARGNEEQATKGRSTIVYAIIGLVLIMLSYAIINIITRQLSANA